VLSLLYDIACYHFDRILRVIILIGYCVLSFW